LLSAESVNDQKEAKRISEYIQNCKSSSELVAVFDKVEHYGLVAIYDAKLKEVENGK
jgi:hypothetical protein